MLFSVDERVNALFEEFDSRIAHWIKEANTKWRPPIVEPPIMPLSGRGRTFIERFDPSPQEEPHLRLRRLRSFLSALDDQDSLISSSGNELVTHTHWSAIKVMIDEVKRHLGNIGLQPSFSEDHEVVRSQSQQEAQ